MSLTIGCLPSRVLSVCSSVLYCPVFVFLALSMRPRWSKRISPSCFGEAMLKVLPACCWMLCASRSICCCSSMPIDARAPVSMAMPSISMRVSTGRRGASIFSRMRSCPDSASCGRIFSASCHVTSASSAAYSANFSSGIAATSRSLEGLVFAANAKRSSLPASSCAPCGVAMSASLIGE